ncbi:MAG: hypothetical protein CMJ29_05890 [Phycisphaerae bacterium]|nr:hypothetical protein [Phycisphaerae bacterium]|tara:strand:+ start:197 stop:553 length:357 start_codon:yes stop_codon:yes gene_type:complete
MHRAGHDPDNIQPDDILCDFCLRATWSLDIPSVEGHHGSILCAECLEQAWKSLVMEKGGAAGEEGWTCTMCLEAREAPWWCSSLNDQARVCRRCTKQAAGALHKSKDWAWEKPTQDEG